jgi:hypothetical protein
MPDATYIACPRCGEPYPMSAMQKRLYYGRTLTCQRCAKPFTVTEETPDPVPAPTVRAWPPQGEALAAPLPPPPPQPRPQGDSLKMPDRGEGLTAGRMALLVGVVVTVVGFLLYLALAPSVHRSREAGRRATCASNLMQLGVALQLYANSNNGRYPDSLQTVVLSGAVPAELLICPSSRATLAPGATPAEQAANLAKGNHASYVYVGKGVSFASLKQVLAYEPLSHHDGQGTNVLYSDGTVQFLAPASAMVAVPQLAPASAPAAAATQPASTQPAPPG